MKSNIVFVLTVFQILKVLDPRKNKRQEKTSAISTMSTTGNLTNEGDDGRIFDGKYSFKYLILKNDGMYFRLNSNNSNHLQI